MEENKEFKKNQERIRLETAINQRQIDRADFVNNMRSKKVLGKLRYFIWKKKLDLFLLFTTVIVVGSIAGVLGKIIREIWKIIFQFGV